MGRALNRQALRRCAAVAPEDFAAQHWGQRPLLSPAAQLPRDFADLLSPAAVDELLSQRGLRTPFIRVAKNGTIVNPSRYTGPGGVGAQVADQVADDRILELFLDGHTVVLQGLHRLWPPIIHFAAALSSDLGHPVQVNAYVTPRSSTGFAAHYDVHDVFVLQIAGEKRWRIHEPVHRDPLRTQPWERHGAAVARRAGETPTIDSVLRPGDALYLPRGYLHAAEALGTMSVHLTVGVHPVTRFDLVEAVLRVAADDPELRTSLPLGADVADAEDIASDLAATVRALVHRVAAVRAEEVAEHLVDQAVSGNRPAPLPPLAQAQALDRLSPQTVLVARGHQRHAVTDEGDKVRVVLAGRVLALPAQTRQALTALLEGKALRVDQLPGLDLADSLVLARRLLREAVVVPVDA